MKLISLAAACSALFALASFGPTLQDGGADSIRTGQDTAQGGASEEGQVNPLEQQVRTLMKLTGAAEMGKEVMDQMMDQFDKMKATGMLPEGFAAKFKELAKPEQLVEMVVPIYAKHLDKETLAAAIEFYASEKGKKFAAAQRLITRDSTTAGQEWGQKLGMRVMQELQR
ncbi:MAG: DUF2059 domain-containing protein [Planctomycetes bacterium]|nr:DUF2059 domain-containing protein [Planctomycetota bacterium]MCB9891974.1 DUF2059 domain-containing protein [Planctomycetota bacterium]MCB9919191.1 DUF2059 domain-containing protein [Planctomycetota bacterium]